MAAMSQELQVIEILEDAYKQNSVYRPWDETRPVGVSAMPDRPATQERALKVLAQVSLG